MNYEEYVEEKIDLPTPYPISTSAKDEKYFEALQRYCGNRFDYINSLLRLGKIPNVDANAVKQTEQTIKCLDEIINDAPQENHKILYRVVSKQFFEELKSASVFYEEGYLSTTKADFWAEEKAKDKDGKGEKIIISLFVSEDIKRIDVSKIKYGSLDSSEFEVLLERDTVLRKKDNDPKQFIVSKI